MTSMTSMSMTGQRGATRPTTAMSELTKTLRTATERDPRYTAVLARDSGVDGKFFYSVRTTGVYCRPSCGARPPRPENVAFHPTADDAERAGFRACKRCRPREDSLATRHARLVVDLCRRIEEAEEVPTLRELAASVGVSPHHLHRLFKAATGLTPKAYAAAQRNKRVQAELAKGQSVTEAIYGAGYVSSGRFYADADGALGMTPSAFREGGIATEIRFAVAECSLGSILVAASSRGVCAILLGDDPTTLVHDLEDRFPRAKLVGGDEAFERTVAAVVGHVEAPNVGLQLPLDVRGTAFQRRVWEALRKIPAGATVSYQELAKRLGAPRAVRAVAGACAANALAVAIPCHRVVRSDGELSGYRWGIERKRALLDRERPSAPPARTHAVGRPRGT